VAGQRVVLLLLVLLQRLDAVVIDGDYVIKITCVAYFTGVELQCKHAIAWGRGVGAARNTARQARGDSQSPPASSVTGDYRRSPRQKSETAFALSPHSNSSFRHKHAANKPENDLTRAKPVSRAKPYI